MENALSAHDEAEFVNCPSCDVALKPRLDIRLKGLERKDVFLKKRESLSFERGDEYSLTTARDCPNCHTSIQLQLEITIKGVQVRTEFAPPKALGGLEISQQDAGRHMSKQYYISQLREAGVVSAFRQAMEVASAENMPNDMESSLLAFLEGATKLDRVPHFVMKEFKRTFPNHFVTFWQFNGVVGVKAGKQLRWFVPAYYINGRDSQSKGAKGLTLRSEAHPAQIEVWVRTRNGYVVGKGEMFNEMKGKRAGDFAKTVSNF